MFAAPTTESGRPRIPNDNYCTPAENVAGLAVGLGRMGAVVPTIGLDFCGGGGDVGRVLPTLMPVTMFLSDLHPNQKSAPFYSTMSSVDARDPGQIAIVLQATGARMIASNPPYDANVFPRILAAGLELLRHGDIELLALMQRANHVLETAVGCRETSDPLFVALVSCTWRTVLFPDGSGNGKQGHAWMIWTRSGRGRTDRYSTFPVSREDAQRLLGARLIKEAADAAMREFEDDLSRHLRQLLRALARGDSRQGEIMVDNSGATHHSAYTAPNGSAATAVSRDGLSKRRPSPKGDRATASVSRDDVDTKEKFMSEHENIGGTPDSQSIPESKRGKKPNGAAPEPSAYKPPPDAADIASLIDDTGLFDPLAEVVTHHVRIGKPKSFFRTHPDPSYHRKVRIYSLKVDGQEEQHYLVDRAMWDRVEGARPCILTTIIDREGSVTLWPIKRPRDGEKTYTSWETAMKAARRGIESWTKFTWTGTRHKIRGARGESSYASEPKWGKVPPFEQLLAIALGERGAIKDETHPIYRDEIAGEEDVVDDDD